MFRTQALPCQCYYRLSRFTHGEAQTQKYEHENLGLDLWFSWDKAKITVTVTHSSLAGVSTEINQITSASKKDLVNVNLGLWMHVIGGEE